MKNLMIALLIAAGVFAIWYWWTHRTTTTSTTSGTGDLVGSLTSADESVNGNGVIITADDGTSSPVIGSTVASNTGAVLDNLTVNSLTNPVVPTGKAVTVSVPVKVLGITVGTKRLPHLTETRTARIHHRTPVILHLFRRFRWRRKPITTP